MAYADALGKRRINVGGVFEPETFLLINPIPPHYKIEKYIQKAGLSYCHIQPSFFMQNISGIHAFEIKHFDRIVVPVKKALTSFIDAEDIGETIAKVQRTSVRKEEASPWILHIYFGVDFFD